MTSRASRRPGRPCTGPRPTARHSSSGSTAQAELDQLARRVIEQAVIIQHPGPRRLQRPGCPRSVVPVNPAPVTSSPPALDQRQGITPWGRLGQPAMGTGRGQVNPSSRPAAETMKPPISRASLGVQVSSPGKSTVESGQSTSILGGSPSSCRMGMTTSCGTPPAGVGSEPRSGRAVVEHHCSDDPDAFRPGVVHVGLVLGAPGRAQRARRRRRHAGCPTTTGPRPDITHTVHTTPRKGERPVVRDFPEDRLTSSCLAWICADPQSPLTNSASGTTTNVL
jgi:hypothetical protein